MTFDVKIPKWLAWPLVVIWAVSIAVGTVAAAVSIRANLHYLESNGGTLPPPYPGQPATQVPGAPKKEPALPDAPPPDDKRKRRLRP